MNRSVRPLLMLPVAAYAGTSDPGGIASAILWLILLAFGAWLVVSIFIGRALARSTRFRLVLAVSLSILPLAYCGFTSYQFDSGLKDLAKQNEALVSIANEYLAKRCVEDRVQRALQQVDPSGGVFLSVEPVQALNIPGTPSPSPETSQMRDNQRRYGESNPVAINDVQYKQPIYWVHQMHADSVLLASPFDFVEAPDRYSHGQPLRATARRQWWLGPGQQAIASSSKQDLEKRIANLSEGRNYWLSQPVESSTARYVLSVADISTLEDRKHWVARARLQLLQKESGEIAAEYVGFAANLAPAYRPGTSYPWERVTVCSGKERDYQEDRMPWNVTGFFFREVVSYKPTSAQ